MIAEVIILQMIFVTRCKSH